MATGSGWVWHDFEDTCSGPLAWDVAASTASQRLDARRVLAAYGDPLAPALATRPGRSSPLDLATHSAPLPGR
jgi:hypothetical protein